MGRFRFLDAAVFVSVCLVIPHHNFLTHATDNTCSVAADYGEVAKRPHIIDISMELSSATVSWGSMDGLGSFCTLAKSQDDGDICNVSALQLLSVHTGTHLDAPSHFIKAAFDSGQGVESLDLNVLNGPAVVMDMKQDSNITAEVLKDLPIPEGTVRLIFKTRNTERGILTQTAFDTSYTGMTVDGARWLIEQRPSVKLVGIDALSIAVFDDLTGPHEILLQQGIIPVEGLVLSAVHGGLYNLHCLPLKIAGADGSPCRCILIP